jgi:hypothetical protein
MSADTDEAARDVALEAAARALVQAGRRLTSARVNHNVDSVYALLLGVGADLIAAGESLRAAQERVESRRSIDTE